MPDAAAQQSVKTPHQVPTGTDIGDFPLPLSPLTPVAPAPRRSAAEEARTIAGQTNIGTLATLTTDGDPWASVVTYGLMADGSPVLCVSRLALHGRNLINDQRMSLAIAEPVADDDDPSDSGRVTLAGVAEEPVGDELELARTAYETAVSAAGVFSSFDDFTFYVLRVRKVRWVGGFGRMASTDAEQYAAAEADPVAGSADFAVRHLNEDHADSLLDMARAAAGHTDATAATCLRADRYGLELDVATPRGHALARVGFAEPATAPDGLRAATVELARRSRGA
jgi:putative heme iron utilization protein